MKFLKYRTLKHPLLVWKLRSLSLFNIPEEEWKDYTPPVLILGYLTMNIEDSRVNIPYQKNKKLFIILSSSTCIYLLFINKFRKINIAI